MLLWQKELFLFNEVFLDKQNIYPMTFMSEIIHSLYPPPPKKYDLRKAAIVDTLKCVLRFRFF